MSRAVNFLMLSFRYRLASAAVIAWSVLTGCGSTGTGLEAAAPAARASFTFDWGAPCKVRVNEMMERKGKTKYVSFLLDMRPVGNELHVRRRDHRSLHADGTEEPMDSADERDALRMLDGILPTMIIQHDGTISDVTGLDEMADFILTFPEFADDPVKQEKLRRAMKSEQARATQKNRAAEYWDIWVGAWVGFSAGRDAPQTVNTTTELFGQEMPLSLVAEHLGPSIDNSGLVHLRISSTIEMSRASRVGMERAVEAMRKLMTDQPLPADLVFRSFEKSSIYEVDTDPATLRPARARRVAKWQINISGKLVQAREIQDYKFDWAHAEGCSVASK